MSLLATNILQRKAPKALSLQAFQGIADRNYRRALLMFDKGDGGVKWAGCVKELLGGGGDCFADAEIWKGNARLSVKTSYIIDLGKDSLKF